MNIEKYKWLEDYIMSKPGVTKHIKAEWNWYSYKLGDKVFAIYCEAADKYQDFGGHDILTLRCEPESVDDLCMSYDDVLPGFYVSKINNISLLLDGNLDDEFIRQQCDNSYAAVFNKLTKKKQKEIMSDN